MTAKILVKFPTRNRPAIFLERLRGYVEKAADLDNILFLITYDSDDQTMSDDIIIKAQSIAPNLRLIACKGDSKSKIEAVNADFDKIPEDFKNWSVVLVVSDDMICANNKWDDIIRDDMQENFADLDGYLWYYDGFQNRISTIACMGRKYYDRFNYIYHPAYKSLWCDNEQTEVADSLSRLKFIEFPIMIHDHPSWGGGMINDALYIQNDKWWKHDEEVYNSRKKMNFPNEI